ncbi:3-deoxy-manno-octulosonate cytidylyltransferase [Aliarcobacter butzleri]|uniref:3-deoxy-manno-octulosonate cytidylyltransferase n=1 Tax=Aliarcobacter butzleri TaxID=28197 RepID=UPI0021B22510|nr:3-deoxy-manno-octulosonate cytidylyltransferase [Aliarcobacter butzleri]MCT7599788.1 3-deoxy-manno-octulosonate cytidylyltransferase [Aliarcobacter butzleri]
MNKIQILDCTLRDGGYINNWEFGNKNILKVIEKLISSNIEIIECGFLDSNIDKEQDTTRFKNIGILNNLLQNINPNSNQSLVAMIEYTKYDLNSLPKVTEDSKVTGIRFSFRKSDYKIALEEMKIILEKGYKLFVQPISTDSYSEEDLNYLIDKVNNLDVYALYIVDTQGSIFPENFKNLFEKFVSKMNLNIKLGFHSHNNMQLSYAIAIEFINLAKNREIIIDSSIYGMGRGAGNLNTELLADYLNKKYNKDYKIENILELIDSYFYALHKNFGWGYSLAHFLSASNETHPNYASYLLDTKRLSINEIKILLEKIPNNEKYEYSKSLIENIYFSYNSNKTREINPPKFDKSKKILLIGSGINLNEKIDEIKQNRDSYQIIALNHKPSNLEPDFYFFNSIKRYEEFSEYISKDKIILSSNIDIDSKYSVDYKELSKIDNDFYSDITAIMMINFLVQNGFTNVYLAGIDGFSKTSLNYSYDESNKVVDNSAIDELNLSIQKAFDILSKKIKIEFITKSIFTIKSKPKIIGVIPARYGSTRLPGKPLVDICGLPMIIHTMKRAMKCKDLDDIVVATDDKRIFDIVEQYGGKAMMTDEKHNNGSERMFEVSQTIKGDIYSLINGDEALINPDYISYGVNALIDNKRCGVSLLYNKFYKRNSCSDFKVVVNKKSEIMYISRNDIPSECRNETENLLKAYHVMTFTKEMLEIYNTLEQTHYDFIESHELLRLMENDFRIQGIEVESDVISVDTPEDLEIVREMMKKDELFHLYKDCKID